MKTAPSRVFDGTDVHGHEHKHVDVGGQRSRLRPNEPVERLHDAELLSLVSGRKLPDAAHLIVRVGLKAILRGEGLTRAQRRRFAGAVELSRRALLARTVAPKLRTSLEVYEFLVPHLAGRREERFHVVGLDCRNTVLGDACIAIGAVDSVQVDPREVFSRAVVWRAAGLVVAHCHPSGDPEPSPHDMAMTRQLAGGAKLLGIRLVDHVIVGDGCYFSLQERGLMES